MATLSLGCSPAAPATAPATEGEGGVAVDEEAIVDDWLPLTPGTTWVYAQKSYRQLPSPSVDVVTATLRITETVVSATAATDGRRVTIRTEESLVAAQPGWDGNVEPAAERSFDEAGGRLLLDLPVTKDGTTGVPGLEYVFPLVAGASWCPQDPPPERNRECVAMGRRTVGEPEELDTVLGRLAPCFEVTQDFNSGGVTEWFCRGVGVVAREYHHGGTRFGFVDRLVHFEPGGTRERGR
jgi:hypothetical protein